jgi:hypothetical protein
LWGSWSAALRRGNEKKRCAGIKRSIERNDSGAQKRKKEINNNFNFQKAKNQISAQARCQGTDDEGGTNMTVDELITDWTEEEKENLKELIEECREREKSIEENRRLSLKGLKRLADEIVGDLVDYFYREKYTLRC